MLSTIFKRWDIGIGNERVSWLHCANATKVIRALRRYLPQDEYMHVNKLNGWMLIRLAKVNYNPDIRLAAEQMQNKIYGGAAYRINVEKLKEALAA